MENYDYKKKLIPMQIIALLPPMVDNGLVTVTSSGEWYKCVVNYDKFKEFDYPFKELFAY